MISARIICDSVAGPTGCRLTTFVCRLPRFVLAQLMTHRMLSRSSSSSRAVPTGRYLEQVSLTPCRPVLWGKNGRGMKPSGPLPPDVAVSCREEWDRARDSMVSSVASLQRLGLHKQAVNRLLEPFLYSVVVVSATDYGNFFALRCHGDAQEEFSVLAWRMLAAYRKSKPALLKEKEWHLPFTDLHVGPEFAGDVPALLKMSTARCARASYMNFFGKLDPADDFRLHDELLGDGHMSPFEHQGQVMPRKERSGNFLGYVQYRKTIPGENKEGVIDLEALWAKRPHWLDEEEEELNDHAKHNPLAPLA